jgi:Mce-associated membrane protein
MTLLDESAPAPLPGAADKTPRRRLNVTPVRALAALVVLAAIAALFFGTRWVQALNSSDLEIAATRDTVLVAAQQVAINLNSLDASKVDAGLDLWEQSSTGPLLDEFKQNRADYAKVVTDSKRVTQATVTDAAVTDLDARGGTARVMVGLDVKVTPQGQDPVVTRQRLQLEMTRTDAGWKASRLSPVRAPAS